MGSSVRKKRKPSRKRALKQMARLIEEHLSQFPEKERDSRVSAFAKWAAKKAAAPAKSRRSPPGGGRSAPSRSAS